MPNTNLKEKEQNIESPKGVSKKCSSYDIDCKTVPDYTKCFMGICGCNNTNMGVADGYCPFIHNKN